MQIIEVTTRRQLEQFVKFPDTLYRECPQYVPALHSDQIHSLTKCPSLEYCTRKMWLALSDDGKVQGRICAIINPRYNTLYGKKCCRFGWFDFIENPEVAGALVETASEWAAGEGMTQIHGPLYYNTLGKQGMLVEGFGNVPQANTLYNYPYYPEFMERLGFVKECDWVQYIMYGSELPDRLKKISDMLMTRHKLHLGSIETLKKNPDRVMEFMRLYSDVFSRSVYNFIPLTEEEMKQEAASSIAMLSDKYCSLVLDENDGIVAFGINFPSISKALQKAGGHLFPFGWIHLLKAVHGHNDTADLMLNGAAEGWNGKGVSAILHRDVSEKFATLGIKYSISNPQIETNTAANVWASYPGNLFMRRRCYIKNI